MIPIVFEEIELYETIVDLLLSMFSMLLTTIINYYLYIIETIW